MNLKKSLHAFAEAKKFLVGGVNSPVRSFSTVNSNPPFISHAHGSKIVDIDQNSYVDYVLSWGPLILGHSHPKIVNALKKAVENGTSYGAPTILETNLAKIVKKIFPSMEIMRFVNSGTESTMSAIRLARGFTNRDKIIKFIGCYHGHCDSLLVKAGSGAATFGEPSSIGVTRKIAHDTISLPFNDIDAVKNAFNQCGEQIAAVIVEPVAGNIGLVLPKPNYLRGLREITQKYGSLLIFDEVMCGFRVSLGGAQEKYEITPDLTCLGKIIGGGLPCAAYGGREDIMHNVSPDGKVYQAGTLSGNPLAMTAGFETLKILLEEDLTPKIIAQTTKLVAGIKKSAQNRGITIQTPQAGSMFGIFFNEREVTNYDESAASNQEMFRKFFLSMLEQGIYMAPSQFETLFMSAVHSDEDIELTISAAEKAFEDLK